LLKVLKVCLIKNVFRVSPDDDNFWAEYSERDFESVYETAHQEQVYGWEKDKIIRYPVPFLTTEIDN
jgi:hypothetical protein